MDIIKKIVGQIIDVINQVGVPLIFALAFIVFLFGVFRYFFLGGANPEKRKEGRMLIIYSIIGFVIMIVVWGLVNLILAIVDFRGAQRPALPTLNGTGSNTNTTQNPTQGTNTQSPSTQTQGTSPNLTSPTDRATRSSPFVGPRE